MVTSILVCILLYNANIGNFSLFYKRILSFHVIFTDFIFVQDSKISNMKKYQKTLHYTRVRNLVEREKDGERVPFSITYACMNGALVDIKEKCMVCIGVDVKHRRRTLKSINSSDIRTIHDVLILRVDDTKIVVS